MKKSTSLLLRTAGIPAILFAILMTALWCAEIMFTSSLAKAEAATTPTFYYSFKQAGTLIESSSFEKSSSPYFWLNSGAKLLIDGSVGKTIQGPLSKNDPWRITYAKSNPLDTGNGYYPQNIFRLLTKSKWNQVEQSIKFNVSKVNTTNTPNLGDWSGVLLMNRYQDGDNLYYAGVRFDGKAVIKKKYRGTYYTLALGNAFPVTSLYNIPADKWMGLRSTTVDLADGSVRIELWVDRNNSGSWERLLTTIDKPGTNGSGVISNSGHAGIRTDYLDISFDDYIIREL